MHWKSRNGIITYICILFIARYCKPIQIIPISKTIASVCVCVCVCARARACAHAHVHTYMWHMCVPHEALCVWLHMSVHGHV